jgi:NAD(P)-dependent dehydrogenase (short-subunit alcohol dehydrogenase family)
MPIKIDLNDRFAVVTGVARGIGRAIAERFVDSGVAVAKVPPGRFVLAEEIAAMAAFCASAECSFTTGGVFDISVGGATY